MTATTPLKMIPCEDCYETVLRIFTFFIPITRAHQKETIQRGRISFMNRSIVANGHNTIMHENRTNLLKTVLFPGTSILHKDSFHIITSCRFVSFALYQQDKRELKQK